ncbi:DUF3344 domain-containing protein [Streptomyces griseoviridis]|uniref:DUF3344 domain-containing protein n=1 Tax=Streptomyces griseoviridis TaxID=45398 RepID=A0A3S9ZHI9_STRGD|nr:DUF3344 domain-containing protein [Streptomyces griseoviridis]AZS87169.1 DUF3344 domain-containing protein [Streptomyces griseoviridis]QCN85978.1 DUF3344 domain-containing protein [Streptomyces griseoviridis]
MRTSPGPLLRRALAGVLALTALGSTASAAAPAPPVGEARRLPFAERYRALQHGGIVRAANVSVSCRATGTEAAPDCPAVRAGGAAVSGDFDMFYVDVDKDPATYNSSRAEVRLPDTARVTYARLYWGGNLRVGEQKPPKDDGRVLLAEPGGRYREVLADTVVGHRTEQGADAYQASADVTALVRRSGPGLYTVAQVNTAMGRSAAGAWGGWTLVVAYEDPAQPLRRLALWDGFDTVNSLAGQEIRLDGAEVEPGARGRAGLVAYGGRRGVTGDSLSLVTGPVSATALSDDANPRADVLNSTISEPADVLAERVPAYANTLGYDSDVFDLRTALRRGGDQLAVRLVSRRDAAWAGVFFVAVDAQQ